MLIEVKEDDHIEVYDKRSGALKEGGRVTNIEEDNATGLERIGILLDSGYKIVLK